MKKLLYSLAFITFCSSCANTWDEETKDMFLQSCLEDATRWTETANEAQVYCDCVMTKMIEKYPTVKKALEKVDSIMVDPELKACRTEMMAN